MGLLELNFFEQGKNISFDMNNSQIEQKLDSINEQINLYDICNSIYNWHNEQTNKIKENDKKIIEEILNLKKVFNIPLVYDKPKRYLLSYSLQYDWNFIKRIKTLEKYYIKDKDVQKITNDIIALIVKSFQDILNCKEKYDNIRKYSGEKNDEEDNYKMLLYQICVFLTRALIREPIKTDFSRNMKQFLLNVFLPLIVSSEDEKNFIETDPEGYHQYINDITFKFKNQSFRTSGCFLVKKICEEYEDIDNFVISFFLEMLNYIINEGQIKSEISGYNMYIKYKTSALIDQFNDKIKLDFSLLIILILKDKLFPICII